VAIILTWGLPFLLFKERFYHSYPLGDIQLPGDQDPPAHMPKVAWSSWGELRAYLDIAALDNTGAPGDHLPANVTKALRRAYYASVSWTDYNVGRVVQALEDNGFLDNTIISFWGDHGWQLGEHGEWCKHTNFDLATNAPMFLHIPGQTDHGIVTSTPTEFLDLMPTLALAAMQITVPPCPTNAADARSVKLCTHGVSLLPLITDPTTPVKPAAYSQYPRGYVTPGKESQGMVDVLANVGVAGPSNCLTKHCTMGYSMLTVVNGTEYRYTEWVDFNTVNQNAPDWTRVVGVELYNHHQDPLENFNVAAQSGAHLVAMLSGLLHRHPVAGVGGGGEDTKIH
jgi:iduronate 2-sulfatase